MTRCDYDQLSQGGGGEAFLFSTKIEERNEIKKSQRPKTDACGVFLAFHIFVTLRLLFHELSPLQFSLADKLTNIHKVMSLWYLSSISGAFSLFLPGSLLRTLT